MLREHGVVGKFIEFWGDGMRAMSLADRYRLLRRVSLDLTGLPPTRQEIDEFIGATLGAAAQDRYRVIINDPRAVAREVNRQLEDVLAFRKQHGDAYYFNWRLKIVEEYQRPFVATHESMRNLRITDDQEGHELALQLRRAFSGIVSGNVREDTAALIEREGPFEIRGSREIMRLLDEMLAAFVAQHRMKISSGDYDPCYVIK